MSTASTVVSSASTQSQFANHKSQISDRKRAANRANAKKSTGPKSEEGKARVSRNATSHGLHCQHLVLPSESNQLFHQFRIGYLVDLHPKTTTELLLVDRIVSASWKLRRLQAAEYHLHSCESSEIYDNLEEARDAYQQAKAEHDDYVQTYGEEDAPKLPDPPPDLDENTPPAPGMTLARLLSKADDRSLDRLHQHEQRLERSIHRSLKELRDLRKSRPHTADYPDHPFLDDQTYNTLHPAHPRDSQFEQFKPTEDPTPPLSSFIPQPSSFDSPPPHSGVVASATTDSRLTEIHENKPTDPTNPPSSFGSRAEPSAFDSNFGHRTSDSSPPPSPTFPLPIPNQTLDY